MTEMEDSGGLEAAGLKRSDSGGYQDLEAEIENSENSMWAGKNSSSLEVNQI